MTYLFKFIFFASSKNDTKLSKVSTYFHMFWNKLAIAYIVHKNHYTQNVFANSEKNATHVARSAILLSLHVFRLFGAFTMAKKRPFLVRLNIPKREFVWWILNSFAFWIFGTEKFRWNRAGETQTWEALEFYYKTNVSHTLNIY